MTDIYTQTYFIGSRETDIHGMCRPSSVLGILQETATEHAELQGVSRRVLMHRHGAFWMMARLVYRLYRPVRFEEELTVKTWQREGKGATIYRDFDLLIDGEPVGEAVTAWVIADFDTRRVLRPNAIPEYAASGKPSVTKSERLQRVIMPEELHRVGHRTVLYSDTDLNGHMNNVRYADVACDAISFSEKRGQYVQEMRICYLAECFAGEDILVLTAQQDRLHFVQGTDEEGKARFNVALRLADDEKRR